MPNMGDKNNNTITSEDNDDIRPFSFGTSFSQVRYSLENLQVSQYTQYTEYLRRFIVTLGVVFYFFGPIIDAIAQATKLSSKEESDTALEFSANSTNAAIPIAFFMACTATMCFMELEKYRKIQEKLERGEAINIGNTENTLMTKSQLQLLPLSEASSRLSWRQSILLSGQTVSDITDFIGLWIASVNLLTDNTTIEYSFYAFFTFIASVASYPEMIIHWNTLIKLNYLKQGIEITSDSNEITCYTKISIYLKIPASMLASTLFIGQIIDNIFGFRIDTGVDVSKHSLWIAALLALPMNYSMIDCKYQYIIQTYPLRLEPDNTLVNFAELSHWQKAKAILRMIGLGSECAEPTALTISLLEHFSKEQTLAAYLGLLTISTVLAIPDIKKTIRHMTAYNAHESAEKKSICDSLGSSQLVAFFKKCCKKEASPISSMEAPLLISNEPQSNW